jgi:hypothetical protein
MNQTRSSSPSGGSINPVDKGTSTVLDTGKDGLALDPNSPWASAACSHQTMDPMREVFRQAFTANLPPAEGSEPGLATATSTSSG